MRLESYEWSRSLSALLSSAAHGCSFCDLLLRTFKLEKLANSSSADPVRPQERTREAFAGQSIVFEASWLNDYMSNAFNALQITAKDVEEGNLQHWGLSGALSNHSKAETFRVIVPEGTSTGVDNIVTLLTYHTTDDAATDMIETSSSSFTPSFENRISQAIAWMKKCEETDEVCKGLGNGPLPTRVLDLGTLNHENQLKLRDDLSGAPGRYACLSYCWGSAQSTMTRSGTIDDFKSGIDITSLPKTIQEAICVTRKLNLQFLWVDALCILQDNEEDKARECSKMDQIYQQAYITIAAARAEDCHDGFLDGTDSIIDILPRLPISYPDGRQGSVLIIPLEKDQFQDPLLSRSWALQEHVLSSRVLIWSKYQLLWLCTNGLQQEQDWLWRFAGPYYYRADRTRSGLFDRSWGIEPGKPGLTKIHHALAGRASMTEGGFCFQFAPDFVHDEMQTLWEHIMEEYSKRKLSVVSDKLPALAGLASRFRDFIQDDYLAGHWRKWLLPHLLWRCVDEGGAVRLPCCPSWSWLSVDGPICIENQESSNIRIFQPRPVAKVIGCKIVLRFETALYDQVTSAQLTIRGYLRAVALNFATQKFCYSYPYNRREPEQKVRKITLDDPIGFWDMKNPDHWTLSCETSSLTTIWCLPLYIIPEIQGYHQAMVRGIALAQSSKAYFKRIGWFYGDAGWCYRERSKGLQERDMRDILII
jgi:hypothetical protein